MLTCPKLGHIYDFINRLSCVLTLKTLLYEGANGMKLSVYSSLCELYLKLNGMLIIYLCKQLR
jgi:hypothetical protein